MQNKLHGLYAPAFTIFDQKGQIDYDKNLQLMKDLVKRGVKGIYFLGTSSGFWLLNDQERFEYTEFILKKISPEIPVIVNVASWNAPMAAKFTKHAVSLNAKYLTAVMPTYMPVDDNMIENYYQEIHQAAPNTPLFCYNIPLIESSARISAPLLTQMAKKGIIHGVKNSTFDVAHMKYLMDYCPKEFTQFCGTEKLMFQIAELGYKPDGWVLTLLCATPKIFLDYFNAMEKNDVPEMSRIKGGILELLDCLQFGMPYVVPATIHIANLLDFDINPELRTPMPKLSVEMKAKIKDIIGSVKNKGFI